MKTAKMLERKHVGFRCLNGCRYGRAYDECPEHGTAPVARIVRVTLEEPIDQPAEPDFPDRV